MWQYQTMFHNDQELMKKPTLTFLFFVLGLIYGCTPSSEDIARRADSTNATKEDVGSALGTTQDNPELLDAATERCIRNYGPTIKRYAGRYGFDWRLILAIMKQESRFSKMAESGKGAEGLMQLMPATARGMGVTNVWDPRQNIMGGARYLQLLARRYCHTQAIPGSEGHGAGFVCSLDEKVKVIAGYHAGPGAVDKYGGMPPYETTRAYVTAVLQRYEEYRRREAALSEWSGPPVAKAR